MGIFITKEYIMKKIVRLTESDINRIVKNVIKESAYYKIIRRDGKPIVRQLDLVQSVLSDLSDKLSEEYGTEEYEFGSTYIPEHLRPYLHAISDAVSNMDTQEIWDAVYDVIGSNSEINELLDEIVDNYKKDK